MFVENSKIEIVKIEEEIIVVGLSLDKFGFPKQTQKLGEMWSAYESKHRIKVTTAKTPIVNYGFWFDKPDNDYDYLVGSAVTEVGNISDELTSCTIPAGRYIKASFNAKDFGDLVCGNGIKNSFESAKKFAEENNLKIKSMPAKIEVYPHELMCVGKENGPEWGPILDDKFISTPITQYPEMYTLTFIE